MEIKKLKAKLAQRKRRECKMINDRYLALTKRAESRCVRHTFGEWAMRWDGLTNFYQTNLHGEPFEFRECKSCGKVEARIKN